MWLQDIHQNACAHLPCPHISRLRKRKQDTKETEESDCSDSAEGADGMDVGDFNLMEKTANPGSRTYNLHFTLEFVSHSST